MLPSRNTKTHCNIAFQGTQMQASSAEAYSSKLEGSLYFTTNGNGVKMTCCKTCKWSLSAGQKDSSQATVKMLKNQKNIMSSLKHNHPMSKPEQETMDRNLQPSRDMFKQLCGLFAPRSQDIPFPSNSRLGLTVYSSHREGVHSQLYPQYSIPMPT